MPAWQAPHEPLTFVAILGVELAGDDALEREPEELTGLGSGTVRTTAGAVDASIRIASEVAQVGRALGVEVEPINGIPAETYERCDDAEVMEEIKTGLAEGAAELGAGRPSMLQDVMKGRRTEIEYLNGYVAAKGAEAGVATPVCEAITDLIKRMERGEMKPDVDNINHLEAFI